MTVQPFGTQLNNMLTAGRAVGASEMRQILQSVPTDTPLADVSRWMQQTDGIDGARLSGEAKSILRAFVADRMGVPPKNVQAAVAAFDGTPFNTRVSRLQAQVEAVLPFVENLMALVNQDAKPERIQRELRVVGTALHKLQTAAFATFDAPMNDDQRYSLGNVIPYLNDANIALQAMKTQDLDAALGNAVDQMRQFLLHAPKTAPEIVDQLKRLSSAVARAVTAQTDDDTTSALGYIAEARAALDAAQPWLAQAQQSVPQLKTSGALNYVQGAADDLAAAAKYLSDPASIPPRLGNGSLGGAALLNIAYGHMGNAISAMQDVVRDHIASRSPWAQSGN
jgi:hypothetical protein